MLLSYLMRLALCLTSIAIILPTLAERPKVHDEPVLASSQLLRNPCPYDLPDQRQPADELFPMKQCQGLKLKEATIDQLQQWMSSGKLTTKQLVTCYIQRITQTDRYVRYVVCNHL